MNFIMMILLIMISWSTYANDALPHGCHSIAVTQATVTLPKSPSSLILMNNVSEMDLWITHPISEPNASSGWSSRLQTNHWSALALGDEAFELSCIESKPGHEQQISCSGSLVICEWPGLKGTDSQKMPYWAAENMPLSELLSSLSQKGFKIPERT